MEQQPEQQTKSHSHKPHIGAARAAVLQISLQTNERHPASVSHTHIPRSSTRSCLLGRLFAAGAPRRHLGTCGWWDEVRCLFAGKELHGRRRGPPRLPFGSHPIPLFKPCHSLRLPHISEAAIDHFPRSGIKRSRSSAHYFHVNCFIYLYIFLLL
jgi:hypothetical protein